jgi:MoxR-like ATPase
MTPAKPAHPPALPSLAAALAAHYAPPTAISGYLLSLAKRAKDSAAVVQALLTGPSGVGKTSAAAWIAEQLDAPLSIVDCATVREPRDMFGVRDLRDGATVWTDSAFTTAISGGGAVILLDELTRATPSVLNALLPLLDARRCATLQERKTPLAVGAGTVILATANIGSEYSGTYALDLAVSERFTRRVNIPYPTKREESAMLKARGADKEIADKLADFGGWTREAAEQARIARAVSPRLLVAVVEDLAAGVTMPEALAASIVTIYEEASERKAVAEALTARGLLS